MTQRKENIVMFPLMAQGHIIPFLALAYKFEQQGYNITFVTTPLNIKKIKPSLPPNSCIQLREIPFNTSSHGLPPDSESTDALPHHLVPRFIESTLSLQPAFDRLVSELVAEQHGFPPFCIVADMFFGWTADVAHRFRVFHTIFCGGGGLGVACSYSLWLNLEDWKKKKKKGAKEFSLPDFSEVGLVHVTQLSPGLLTEDLSNSWTVFQRNRLAEWLNTDGILFNTVEELDKIGLAYVRRRIGKPVWPIGPVLLSVDKRYQSHKEIGTSKQHSCTKWLTEKPPKSVLYVSFGSQNTLSPSQMMQLAMVLEASNKNFIWVTRPPLGFDMNTEFKIEKWLPEGFGERTQRRGFLVENWAPQVEILSHTSISTFLSHCGWNSVLEALSFAVPLLGWPMGSEQCFNVKLLEEVGVCIEVARGTKCEVKLEDMAAMIELAMGETERGNEMRRKACEVKEMIRKAARDEDGSKGSSEKSMDDFFNAATTLFRG